MVYHKIDQCKRCLRIARKQSGKTAGNSGAGRTAPSAFPETRQADAVWLSASRCSSGIGQYAQAVELDRRVEWPQAAGSPLPAMRLTIS